MSTKSSSGKQQKHNNSVKNEMEKYQVIKLLGEGSFGRVYKAKVVADSSFVALKVISKGRRSNRELIGLRRECEIQRHLHHPNIIHMIDSFETTSEIVVVTEFAHKELNTILGKEGYLSEERACPIIWDLVSALNYLHSHRVLHRDLKPQNVLLDSKNRAKLCDFGFARNMSTGTHVLTSIKGTPLYMAPELIEEQPYDYKADLWSLGCIMFEMLVGAPPFCSASLLHLFRLIQHEQIEWPTFVSEHCNSFLKGLLQKDPNNRITWEGILNHPFIQGHILICEESSNKPLTRAPSINTLQAKEKQRKSHISNKNKSISEKSCLSKASKSPHDLNKGSDNYQDSKNNNSLSNQLKSLSLENNSAQSTPCSSRPSQMSGATEKLSFIEESHPVETEEWIVFLQKTMEEVISGEVLSLTQCSLANIIVSPLRNSNTSSKVLSFVSRLLSLPFVVTEISGESLEQIKKVYLEVKLVPNLIYSCKLLMRVKREDTPGLSPSPQSEVEETYKSVNDLTEEDFETVEYIFMLITHLIHLENEFLIQLCDAIAVLKFFSILKLFLSISKINLQIVMDLISVLTHILRIFPENSDLVDKIILGEDKTVSFVDFLRHHEPLMRERACFLLLYLGKTLPTNKMEIMWNEDVKDTLEALMYDSIESVRNAAEKTVEDLKCKEFYKHLTPNKQ